MDGNGQWIMRTCSTLPFFSMIDVFRRGVGASIPLPFDLLSDNYSRSSVPCHVHHGTFPMDTSSFPPFARQSNQRAHHSSPRSPGSEAPSTHPPLHPLLLYRRHLPQRRARPLRLRRGKGRIPAFRIRHTRRPEVEQAERRVDSAP